MQHKKKERDTYSTSLFVSRGTWVLMTGLCFFNPSTSQSVVGSDRHGRQGVKLGSRVYHGSLTAFFSPCRFRHGATDAGVTVRGTDRNLLQDEASCPNRVSTSGGKHTGGDRYPQRRARTTLLLVGGGRRGIVSGLALMLFRVWGHLLILLVLLTGPYNQWTRDL
jgi:hypothetical protein